MRKAELAAAVGKKIRLSPQSTIGLVEAVLDAVKQILMTGETVKIPLFGNFSVRAKRARIGRNPKTGKEAEITARRVVTFRPSRVFREAVGGTAAPTDALTQKQGE